MSCLLLEGHQRYTTLVPQKPFPSAPSITIVCIYRTHSISHATITSTILHSLSHNLFLNFECHHVLLQLVPCTTPVLVVRI